MYFGSTIYTDISSKTVLAFCCFRFRKFEDAIFLTRLLWLTSNTKENAYTRNHGNVRPKAVKNQKPIMPYYLLCAPVLHNAKLIN